MEDCGAAAFNQLGISPETISSCGASKADDSKAGGCCSDMGGVEASQDGTLASSASAAESSLNQRGDVPFNGAAFGSSVCMFFSQSGVSSVDENPPTAPPVIGSEKGAGSNA